MVAVRRIRRAFGAIYVFFKRFVFDAPKVFVWTIPKKVIALPLLKICKWGWTNRGRFPAWCNHKLRLIPAQVGKVLKAVWKGVKATPNALVSCGKWTWKCTKFLAKEIPKLIFVRIPAAIKHLALWIWNFLSITGTFVVNTVRKSASLLHTLLSALLSLFRNLTFNEIWAGFRDLLHTIFVDFPAKIWSWLAMFGEVFYKFTKALLGRLGWFLQVLGWLALYVPAKIGIVLQSLGASVLKAGREIRIWVDPKR